jgi:hypothetical protein
MANSISEIHSKADKLFPAISRAERNGRYAEAADLYQQVWQMYGSNPNSEYLKAIKRNLRMDAKQAKLHG